MTDWSRKNWRLSSILDSCWRNDVGKVCLSWAILGSELRMGLMLTLNLVISIDMLIDWLIGWFIEIFLTGRTFLFRSLVVFWASSAPPRGDTPVPSSCSDIWIQITSFFFQEIRSDYKPFFRHVLASLCEGTYDLWTSTAPVYLIKILHNCPLYQRLTIDKP